MNEFELRESRIAQSSTGSFAELLERELRREQMSTNNVNILDSSSPAIRPIFSIPAPPDLLRQDSLPDQILQDAQDSFEKRNGKASEDLAEFLKFEQQVAREDDNMTAQVMHDKDVNEDWRRNQEEEDDYLREEEYDDDIHFDQQYDEFKFDKQYDALNFDAEEGDDDLPFEKEKDMPFMAAADQNLDEAFFQENVNIDDSEPWGMERSSIVHQDEYASSHPHRKSHGNKEELHPDAAPKSELVHRIFHRRNGLRKVNIPTTASSRHRKTNIEKTNIEKNTDSIVQDGTDCLPPAISLKVHLLQNCSDCVLIF